jgi:hypothetical protein
LRRKNRRQSDRADRQTRLFQHPLPSMSRTEPRGDLAYFRFGWLPAAASHLAVSAAIADRVV